MNVDYLLSDELEYELIVRGYPGEGTVAEKRKRLRPALRMEKEGVVFSSGLNRDPDDEIENCAKKVDELKSAIDSFNFENAPNEYKRYCTRLWHVTGRINRINFGGDDSRKGQLLIKCGEISDFLEETVLLLDPIRIPKFPSVIPAESGNTSATNISENANPGTSPCANPGNLNQSRNNVSLLDIDPQDLGVAIENLQINNPLPVTPTPVTQTITTTNAPGAGISPVTRTVIRPQTSVVAPVPSSTNFNPGLYTFAAPQPVAHSMPGQYGGTVWQNQYPIPAFQPQYDWQSRVPGQPQSNLYMPSFVHPPRGVLTATSAGNSSQGTGFTGLPDFRQQSENPVMGAGMNQHDRLRIFKTVSQWNLQFDGLSGINNFLEGVEELRIACGISRDQLMGAAIVLFKGVALDWFRANVSQSHSWDNLVAMLRVAFLPGEYEEDVWSDIRARTQGQFERSTTYMSVMQNLFSKLAEKPNEQTRLRIVRRNLLPSIQSQLALMNFDSLSELTLACQKCEDVQARIDRFKPPPTNPLMVAERELMYNPKRYRQQINLVGTPSTSGPEPVTLPEPTASSGSTRLVCWNCRKSGHMKRDCKEPRQKHCFSCGTPGVTKATCPNHSGN